MELKKFILIFSLVLALIAGFTYHAAAVPVDGDITFVGSFTLNNNGKFTTSSSFASFYDIKPTTSLFEFTAITASTPTVFTKFSYSPSVPQNFLLWSATVANGDTYTFWAQSATVLVKTDTNLSIEGTGMAYRNGSDGSPGLWDFDATISQRGTKGFTASFSAIPVREPGTLGLLGAGLIGICGFRRKNS